MDFVQNADFEQRLEIARFGDSSQRFFLAGEEPLEPEVAQILAHDVDPVIRSLISDNRSVSRELLREMAEQDRSLRLRLCGRIRKRREATPNQREAIVALYRSVTQLLCVATLGDVWRHFTQKPQ